MVGHHPACVVSLLLLLASTAHAAHDTSDVQLAVLNFAAWATNGVPRTCRLRSVCANMAYCLYWSLCPTTQAPGASSRVTTLLALPWGPEALRHLPHVPVNPLHNLGMWEHPISRGRDDAPNVDWSGSLNSSAPPLAAAAPTLDSALAVAVASLSDLRALHVSGVGLQGALPGLWGSSLPLLGYLNLSHNALMGTLPPSFGRLTSLTILDLSNNRLTGAVPQAWGALTNLRSINLSNNEMGCVGNFDALTGQQVVGASFVEAGAQRVPEGGCSNVANVTAAKAATPVVQDKMLRARRPTVVAAVVGTGVTTSGPLGPRAGSSTEEMYDTEAARTPPKVVLQPDGASICLAHEQDQ